MKLSGSVLCLLLPAIVAPADSASIRAEVVKAYGQAAEMAIALEVLQEIKVSTSAAAQQIQNASMMAQSHTNPHGVPWVDLVKEKFGEDVLKSLKKRWEEAGDAHWKVVEIHMLDHFGSVFAGKIDLLHHFVAIVF